MSYASSLGSVEGSQPWPLGTVAVGDDCRQTVWEKLSPSLALRPEDERASVQRHTPPEQRGRWRRLFKSSQETKLLTVTASQPISPNHGAHSGDPTQ